MQEKAFVLRSQADDLPLHGVLFEPDGEKKGIVQILHGMCEYKERYAALMQFLASEGYVVVCHDHRGHGDSVLQESDRGYFYEKSGKYIVRDAVQVTEYIRGEYPDLRITLFGHSMGSMVARCYLQNDDTRVDKVVICGSPGANPFVGIAITLTKTITVFRGKKHRSRMLAYLSTGKGNKRYAGEGSGAWLSRNRENVEAFHSNPKRQSRFTCNGYENLFRLMKSTYDKKAYKVQNPQLPIHFISGSDDAVMGGIKGWANAIAALKEVGYEKVSGKLYEEGRHEIFSDFCKDEVLADLLTFLQS